MQEPKALADATPRTREVHGTCPVHGEFVNKQYRSGERWMGRGKDDCGKCAEERIKQADEAAKAREEEQRKSDEARRIKTIMARCGLPDRFSGRTFESYEAKEPAQQKVLDICISYAQKFPELRKAGTSMIFYGNTGTGKTHLACSIANHLMQVHGMPVLFTSVLKAVRTVKQTYNKTSKVSEQEAINSFCEPDLLILDEIGVQFGSEAEKLILFEIINERYENLRPTILISNLSIEEMRNYLGDRIISRMKENNGKALLCDWKGHR